MPLTRQGVRNWDCFVRFWDSSFFFNNLLALFFQKMCVACPGLEPESGIRNPNFWALSLGFPGSSKVANRRDTYPFAALHILCAISTLSSFAFP